MLLTLDSSDPMLLTLDSSDPVLVTLGNCWIIIVFFE